MKKTILFLLYSLFLISAKAQIAKGNWLLNGSTSFSYFKSSSEAAAQFSQTNFQISPKIGYFLRDKFAVGISPSFIYGNNNVNSSNSFFNGGPFC